MDKRTQAAGSFVAIPHGGDDQRTHYEHLGKLGLKADFDVRTAEVQAEELAKQNDLAQKEVETFCKFD